MKQANKFLTSVLASLAIILMAYFRVAAADPSALYQEGNRLYEAEKYNEAIQSYLTAADAGFAAPELYFNLGNAFYKSGDYPSAILYYERALKLAPADPDVLYNLKMANLHTVDKIEPLPKVFYEKWAESFLYGKSLTGRTWTAIALLWAAVGLIGIYLFAGNVRLRKAAFIFGFILLISSTLTYIFAWNQSAHFNTQKEAVVFSESVYIKSSPDEKSSSLFMLHSGTKVQILDELKDWKKVRIANGNEGWIGSADVKGI